MAQYLCIWVRAYWFSVTSFSKWLPGGHIRSFRFWTVWFRQCNSSLLWIFSFKFHVHVPCVSFVAFKMAALWFWTMFNCNPPIAHSHPLLWCGGILVDQWSTISSLSLVIWCNWYKRFYNNLCCAVVIRCCLQYCNKNHEDLTSS